MKSQLLIALKSFVLLTFVTGVLYPLAMTGVSSVVFSRLSTGSLVDGVGSDLIGQDFHGQGEFWGRLSQTAEKPYNAASSGASNLGTSNPVLKDNATARLLALGVTGKVPVDLVTSSASGLDPDISPQAARVQIPRVAKATGLPEADLEALVARSTLPPTFGILGQARVNVVSLNLELKKLH